MARIVISLSLLAVACVLIIVSVCAQPADLQDEQDSTPDIRATVVAEVTATADTAHTLSLIPTAAPRPQAPPGSFVSTIPISSPIPTNTPRPTRTPRPTPMPMPVGTPTLSSVVEDISPSVVQVVTPSGTGSGFVVDVDGLVLTNAHVVDGFSTVNVRFSGGRSRTGKVLGVDEVADLALIEVTTYQRLAPTLLGDSDAVKVGEEVIAMGFPAVDTLGSTPTITRGIISAKRSLDSGMVLLQTDAAINPGNSGGPLFRRDGQVIGVNTAKIFRSDDGRPLEGIGMAVSVNDARERLDSLARGESVLLDRPPSFGTLELETVLDDFLPRSFERLDPEAEDMSIIALGLEDYFSNLALYASIEPFQMIMAATGELSDLERIATEYELSNTDVFMNEVAKGALLELDNADLDTGIDDFGLLDLRQVGDISASIWIDISFDGIGGIRAETIMFLRDNHVGMVWIYYFPETYPSVSLDEVARAIDVAMR